MIIKNRYDRNDNTAVMAVQVVFLTALSLLAGYFCMPALGHAIDRQIAEQHDYECRTYGAEIDAYARRHGQTPPCLRQ